MSAPVYEGMVLQYLNSFNVAGVAKSMRIIWISEGGKHVFFVHLEGDTCMPKYLPVSMLEANIEEGVLREIPDPFKYVKDEESIPQEHRNLRDQSWKVVKELWFKPEPDVLFKNHRNQSISEAAMKFGLSPIQVKRIITRFWQRGMNKNALLPDLSNCGGKGKSRKATDKKRGRPPKIRFLGDNDEGVNVDENIKKIISKTLTEYWQKAEKPTFTEALAYMNQTYFSHTFNRGGKNVVKVFSTGKITYHQLYYWAMQDSDFKKIYIARQGQNKYDLEKRELLKNSTMQVSGSGRTYQIDASIADIYLVCSVDRSKIVGRPVIYVVIDVWSRLIVGMYAGFEGPSWLGAMMALDNVMEDKVSYCKRYGIDITEKMWPTSSLPEIILADRGEFESHKPENLINNLGVDVDTTAPNRGDLKGIVENRFNLINGKIRRSAPGAIDKEYKERCKKDPRLKATLTMDEFTKWFILTVIKHNTSVIEGYPMQKEMIAELVKPVPVQLWYWGIKNRKGRQRVFDRDIVRLNLLPKEKASVSRAGIKFHGLYYSCDLAILEQWYFDKNKRTVDVVYDPRSTNHVYIPDEKGKSFVICDLLEKSSTYKEMSFDEVDYLEELKEDIFEYQRKLPNEFNDTSEVQMREMFKKAKKKTQEAVKKSGQSNAARIKDIRSNKKEAKEEKRAEESWEMGNREKKQGKVISVPPKQIEQVEEYTSIDPLAELKEKRRKNDQNTQ